MKAVSHPIDPIDEINFDPVSPDRVVEGAPLARSKLFYTSSSDEFFTGIYECTAGAWRISYTEDEFCTMIEGTVRLIADNGETQEFTAPQSFLIPAGYSGIWHALTPLRKFFVIYEKRQD